MSARNAANRFGCCGVVPRRLSCFGRVAEPGSRPGCAISYP